MNKALWILKIVVALLLAQTLFFKFTSAEESVWIFSQLGAEPWGRYLSGVIELIAAILILIPKTQIFGALLTLGAMSGAILGHVFFLGYEVNGDGGLLFAMAIICFTFSGIIAYFSSQKIIALANKCLS